MHKKLTPQKIIVALIGSLLATSSFAGPRNRVERDESRIAGKEESIGVGSGALIGAAAGGPIGFVLGAAFGGWLGDRFHHERTARADADERAAKASVHAGSLQTLLAASERAAAAKDAALLTERVAHRRDLQEALSVEVFFRTEESGLGGATEERLAKLAALIEPMDGAVIRLEGHTDARGTETFNTTLSSARAEAVRDALIRGGMPADRVIVTATGETGSTAAEQDVDGMALDRRVEMNVVDDDATRVAEVGTN
jgi:outer membrane protein OmpA-like peptidoglycan-associated protein